MGETETGSLATTAYPDQEYRFKQEHPARRPSPGPGLPGDVKIDF